QEDSVIRRGSSGTAGPCSSRTMTAADRKYPKNSSRLGPGRLELRCPQEASGSAQAVLPCRGGRDQVSASVQSAASAELLFLCMAGMLASSSWSQNACRLPEGAPSG